MIPSTAATRDRNIRMGLVAFAGVALAWPLLPVHPPLACPLRTVTGIPCPLCGMTRAVVAGAHLDIVKSLSYNPGGIFVIALGIVALIRPSILRITPPTWAIFAVLGTLWIWNIGFNPTFNQLLWR